MHKARPTSPHVRLCLIQKQTPVARTIAMQHTWNFLRMYTAPSFIISSYLSAASRQKVPWIWVPCVDQGASSTALSMFWHGSYNTTQGRKTQKREQQGKDYTGV